jgi:hypothetical protein
MSEEHAKDRIGQTRLLWRMFFAGLLASVLGAAVAYVGYMAILDGKARRPIADFELALFAVGAIVVCPLGVGSSLAAATGLLLAPRFRLRPLLIAISVFGVLIAVPSYVFQGYLYSWEGCILVFPVPSFFPGEHTARYSEWGTLHAVSAHIAVTVALAACFLPFFILAIFLRPRRTISENPISD